eukprot:3441281-Rhodomonas_salina.1
MSGADLAYNSMQCQHMLLPDGRGTYHPLLAGTTLARLPTLLPQGAVLMLGMSGTDLGYAARWYLALSGTHIGYAPRRRL